MDSWHLVSGYETVTVTSTPAPVHMWRKTIIRREGAFDMIDAIST